MVRKVGIMAQENEQITTVDLLRDIDLLRQELRAIRQELREIEMDVELDQFLRLSYT